MKRLVFLVEGDTEVILVNKHIIPFLYSQRFTNQMNVQTILSSRKKNSKGGNISYEYFSNDVRRIFAQGNVIITSLLDFFRLPPNFPGYTNDASRIDDIEESVKNDLGALGPIYPYIQKYELEALMFSSMEGFNLVVDDEAAKTKLQKLVDLNAPEDINGGCDTAPSKRLEAIFAYEKTVDGEMILDMIGLEKMREMCPRFNTWIELLVELLSEDNH